MISLIKSFWQVHHQDKLLNKFTHIRNGAILGGAISSISLYFSFFYGNFSKTFQGYTINLSGSTLDLGFGISMFTAIGFTCLISWIVDASQMEILPNAFDLLLGKKDFGKDYEALTLNDKIKRTWRSYMFIFGVFTYGVGCTVLSGVIDWYGRGQTATLLVKEPTLRDEAALRDSLNRMTQKSIYPIQKELDKLIAEKKAIEKRIELENPDMISVIKKKKDRWGWYATELNKKKEKAVKHISEQIAAQRQLLQERMSAENKNNDIILTGVNSANTMASNSYLSRLDFTEKFSGGIGAFCMLIILFSSLMLSLQNEASQFVPTYQVTHNLNSQNGSGTVNNQNNYPLPTNAYSKKPQNGRVQRASILGGGQIQNKRSCENCDTDISNRRSDAKFCSNKCRKDYWEKHNA